MNKKLAALALMVSLPFSQSGCLGGPATYEDGADEDVAESAEEIVTINSLTSNSLTSNSLTSNSLTSNSLTSNSLTSNSLTSNALTAQALEDPEARLLLKYVAGCALPEGAHFDIEIEGQTYGFDGELGLAPEWGHPYGHCNSKCRSWVSGCVISRLDYLGEAQLISIRGKHNALSASASERAAYPEREATYYGDIFASPQRIYACLSPGETSIPRVCGPSLSGCVLDIQGECDDVCKKASKKDGSFPMCESDRESGCGTEKHVGSVTVFLP